MSGFTPADLVQLPRLGGLAASAIGKMTLAAGEGQKGMSKPVAKAYTSLGAAHAALQASMVAQFGDSDLDDEADEPATQEVDRIVDNCWSGLDDRLLGFTKLPAGTPRLAEAATLRRRLFPEKLSFLKLPYKLEWSESKVRLDLIERDNLAPAINDLAGKQFLPAILEAHANYGKALGMDKPLPGVEAAPQVKGALDAFASALRAYVVKVMGSVDDDVPATQALADKLLAPLASWTSSAPKAAKDEAPAGGTASAPTAPADGGTSGGG